MKADNQLVDELGVLLADKQALVDRENAIKAMLNASGLDVVEGSVFRVTVSRIDATTRPDWKAIAKRCNPSRQLVAANQVDVAASVRVACKAKRGV